MVAEPVQAAGHDLDTVFGQGWGGLSDQELWPKVCSENVFFITADKGFGDIRKFPPGSHFGILVLRPDRESIVEYRALIENMLTHHDLDALAGTVTVATPRGVRVRRSSA